MLILYNTHAFFPIWLFGYLSKVFGILFVTINTSDAGISFDISHLHSIPDYKNNQRKCYVEIENERTLGVLCLKSEVMWRILIPTSGQ